MFKHIIFKLAQILLSVFPLKRNRVFFNSFYGKSYSDNPKAVSEMLHDLYGDRFEYVWVLNQRTPDVPDYVRICHHNTLRMLYYMCTARVWVTNVLQPKGTYKRRGQYYIQVWHGDRGFKKILKGVPGKNDNLYESRHADLVTAGSRFGEQQYYRKCMDFQGEILMTGCPRNDIFFRDTTLLQQKIRQRYGIATEQKVLIFAPTFRERFKREAQTSTLDFNRVRTVLEQATGDKWMILIRSHTANEKYGFDVEYNDNVKLATDYPDMNELLQVADILVSDYSSSIGDFALSGRLCLLYQDDIDSYTNEDRGLMFNMADSPFLCANTPEEMYALLERVPTIDAKANCEAINQFYQTQEHGDASVKVARIIGEKCGIYD